MRRLIDTMNFFWGGDLISPPHQGSNYIAETYSNKAVESLKEGRISAGLWQWEIDVHVKTDLNNDIKRSQRY